MKITKYLCLLLIIMAFVMEAGDAKRGGGSSRSSSSRSYSGGSSYRGGSSSSRGGYYKKTYYQSSSARVIPRTSHIVTVGVPIGYHAPYYYDYSSRMYWNGSSWYSGMGPPSQGGGAVAVVIVMIILIIICAIVCAAAKGQIGDGEYESTTIVEEHYEGDEIPENKFNYGAQVFQPGQPRPPNTILCNMGHLMSVTYQHPYPDEPDVPPECDNCQQQINPSMGIFHCSNCGSDNGIDLCGACGNQRMMADQMLFQQFQQQQMQTQGMQMQGMQMQQPMMQQQPYMQAQF